MEATVSEDMRRAALAERVAFLGRSGWRVESHTNFQAVMVKTHRPNHILHLILSIVTLGLWLIVWAIVALKGKQRGRMVITVNEAGEIRGA